jgi:hypothetical protein
VSRPERASPLFADTEIDVDPLPVPDVPFVIVTYGDPLEAVQLHAVPANTLTVAVPPPAGIETVDGETE